MIGKAPVNTISLPYIYDADFTILFFLSFFLPTPVFLRVSQLK